MNILKSITSQLTMIQQACDELLAVGEAVSNLELVKVALRDMRSNGPPLWRGYLLVNISLIGTGCGMTSSIKKFGRVHN